MEKNSLEISYTTINHIARRKLNLSMHEYAVADVIYNLSTNPKNEHLGWCYASKESIADILELGHRTVERIIAKLINKKLLQRSSETKFLRCTSYWSNNVIVGNPAKMAGNPPKWRGDTAKMAVGLTPILGSHPAKMADNKDINNNINNENLEKIEKIKKEINKKLGIKKEQKT